MTHSDVLPYNDSEDVEVVEKEMEDQNHQCSWAGDGVAPEGKVVSISSLGWKVLFNCLVFSL